MSLALVGIDATANPDARHNIASNELGINAEKITAKYTPEVRAGMPDINGEWRAFATSTASMCALTITGEVLKLSVGALAAVYQTAFVPVNNLAHFGQTGGFYLTSGDLELDRADWYMTTVEFESRPGIA